MLVLRKVTSLRRYLDHQKEEGGTVGFVPTMGALHKGHLSLVYASLAGTDCTVVSIFVNPKQFNEQSDLEKYPRKLQDDLNMLYEAGSHVAFVPPVDEVYPPDSTVPELDLGGLDKTMEGKFRPGHFQGMAQVVKRFLDIVRPDKLFMGQKDYQQYTIVRHMIRSLDHAVDLIMCPIVREPHGLAMSSRNERLSPEFRQKAGIIHETLEKTRENLYLHPVSELKEMAMQSLSISHFKPEYFEIIEGNTLEPLDEIDEKSFAVACCAVRVGDVRLIDNMILQK